MDALDIVSSAIQKITAGYGKRLAKKTTAPEIVKTAPTVMNGKGWRLGFSCDEIMPQHFPEKTYYIAGHGSGHVMDGILTPVSVHAVWLDCGQDEGIIWLSADVVGLTNVEVKIIRDKIFGSSVIKGVKAVHVSCTHSHSGIDTVGYWGKPFLSIPADGKDSEYMEQLFEKCKKVSEEAYLNRTEGKLYAGRVPVENGLFTKRKFPQKHEYLSRIRFAPNNGENETWILNMGAHPNTLGGANRKLSAEYPYFLRQKIKEVKGANVLFGIGAIGGMDAAQLDEEDKLHCIQLQGELYANAAIAVSEEKELAPQIKFITRNFYLPVSNNVLALLAIKGTMSCIPYPCKDSETGIALLTEMTYMTLGEQKILLLPGEQFVNTVYGGYLSQEKSPVGIAGECNPTPLAELAGDDTMIEFGITNDMTGYVVPENDFVLNPGQPYLNGVHDKFDDNHYHETNSMGPRTQRIIADTFEQVLKDFGM